MKSTTFVLAALAIAGCTMPASTSRLTPAERTAVSDSVRATVMRWATAIDSLKPDQMTRFYATDSTFRWFDDGQLTYHTRDDVAKAFHGFAAGMERVEFALTDLQIVPLGPDAASISSEFTQKMVSTNHDTTGFAGAISATMVRGDSGWTFLIGHSSLILPQGKPAAPRS